jgi:hypothetical protein
MIRKTVFAGVTAAGLGLAAMPTAALAVGPGFPAALVATPAAIEQASFWGFPFHTVIAAGAATPNAYAW